MSEELAHIRRRLSDEGQKTAAYFEALSAADWDQQIYQTGSEWRVREILAHFISAERTYQKYLGEVLGGGAGAPESMDIDEFNESEVPAIQGTPAELIELYKQVRIDTLDLTKKATRSMRRLGSIFDGSSGFVSRKDSDISKRADHYVEMDISASAGSTSATPKPI